MHEHKQAERYLEQHGDYTNALKVILNELETARNAGQPKEEERLCSIMTALRGIRRCA